MEITEVEEIVRGTLDEEHFNNLMEGYQEVKFFPNGECDKCGLKPMTESAQRRHMAWHRGLSITMRLLQQWASSHQVAHGEGTVSAGNN